MYDYECMTILNFILNKYDKYFQAKLVETTILTCLTRGNYKCILDIDDIMTTI